MHNDLKEIVTHLYIIHMELQGVHILAKDAEVFKSALDKIASVQNRLNKLMIEEEKEDVSNAE